jgi:hypothetical protein
MDELSNAELATRLRENAEWCDANEWEIPICMGDNQREAAKRLDEMSVNDAKLKIYNELATYESRNKSPR